MFMKRKKILSWSLAMAISLLLCGGGIAYAKVTGVCSNCHTMHGSQGGETLDISGPSATLLKGGCVGCHSSDASSTTYSLDTSTVPVVNFTGAGAPAEYLSGGNFYWVAQSSGGDAKGHNVFGISDQDDNILAAEGAPGDLSGCSPDSCHATLAVKDAGELAGPLFAAPGGCQGCHLNVMHHTDDGTGTKYVGASPWYRFLSGHASGGNSGVAGIEHSGWGAFNEASSGNTGGTDHNEYLGVPVSKTGTTSLANKSMTAFCSGCHGNFHVQQDSSGSWIRHPSDAVIPDEGEFYSMSIEYDPRTPLARSATALGLLGDTPSGYVDIGTDMVMCLSCHRSHGSGYDDMLRWDYSGMIAGGGTGTLTGKGCFYCHTDKD
jgi:hypothetical protein